MQKADVNEVICTSMNQRDWEKFGLSWFASLHKHGDYAVSLIDCGLDLRTLDFLREIGVKIVKTSEDGELETIVSVLEHAHKNSVSFAYWKCNCYFQSNLKDVFSQGVLLNYKIEDGKHKPNWDFFAGSPTDAYYLLNYIRFFERSGVLNSYSQKADYLVNLLYKVSDGFIKFTQDWRQQISLHWESKDGVFYSNGELVKVVSIPDTSSSFCENYLFKNSNKQLLEVWNHHYRKNSVIGRKLL